MYPVLYELTVTAGDLEALREGGAARAKSASIPAARRVFGVAQP